MTRKIAFKINDAQRIINTLRERKYSNPKLLNESLNIIFILHYYFH